MLELHEFLFLALAFFSEIIGTASGVSSSSIFVPLAKLLETVQTTLVLTAVLHVAGNTVRAFIFGRDTNWILVFKFGVPSLFFTALGAQYSDYFSSQIFSFVLGIFLVAMASFLLIKKVDFAFKGKWLPYAGGALSGLLTGLLGSGGAIRSLAMAGFQLNPVAFVATSTVIDFSGDVLRLMIYLKKGYLTDDHQFYIPLLIVIAILANIALEKWIRNLHSDQFKKIILAFVFCLGWVSIISSFIKN